MSAVTKTGGRDATTAVVPGRGLLSIGNPRTPEPEGYQWTALAEVARMESGHTPSRTKPEYWNEGIPWIGIKDATGNDGKIILETLQSISQLGVDNSSTRLLPAGTVCLSRTASVGYVVQMGIPMCTSQDFVNWVSGPRLNPSYLRYLLLAEAESIRSWATGSTHKTLYFPEAKALHVLLPSERVQDRAVEVFGALDDKIAANRHVTDIAMELGERLVRRGATGRTPLAISDLADVVMGSSPKGEYLNEEGVGVHFYQGVRDFGRVFPEPRVSTASPVRMAPKGATLFAVRAPVGEVNLAVEDVCIGRGVASLSSTEWPATLHFSLRAFKAIWDEYQGGGTVFASVNGRDVRETRLPMPNDPDGSIERFLMSLLARAVHAERENSRLVATRDELLPLLMSGKITVKDAEKTVEEVV